jgi:hypothetical protein
VGHLRQLIVVHSLMVMVVGELLLDSVSESWSLPPLHEVIVQTRPPLLRPHSESEPSISALSVSSAGCSCVMVGVDVGCLESQASRQFAEVVPSAHFEMC